jgi:hypothetical protein
MELTEIHNLMHRLWINVQCQSRPRVEGRSDA